MFIDSIDFEDGDEFETDICIVGAGVAGISFAREFFNTGIDITVLESGSETPSDEIISMNDVRNVGLEYKELNDLICKAVGGNSHSWHISLPENKVGLRLKSMDSIDFEKRKHVPYSGWPITKKDLNPYYKRAHELFEIGPYRYDAEHWLDEKTSPQLSLGNSKLKTTIFQFARKEIFSEKYPQQIKNSDNVRVFKNATVLKVELSEDANQAQSVLATNLNEKKFRVKAKFFILANGGLEIPRLLLQSDDIMKEGVGNQNDLVGRFFMEHLHLRSGYFFPTDHNFFNRSSLYEIHNKNGVPVIGKISLTENTIKKENLLNFTASLHFNPMVDLKKSEYAIRQISRIMTRFETPDQASDHLKTIFKNLGLISYISFRKLMGGDKEKWYNSKYKYHGYLLGIMSEQLPNPESRVLLDPTRKDRFGQSQIKLNWKLKSDDIRNIRRTQEIIDSELRRKKLGYLKHILEDDFVPEKRFGGGWHHMGTTRMSANPKTGVVNENCRVHGIENLYIAGCSVFTTGGYANPVLTISALTIRLADHIKRNLNL